MTAIIKQRVYELIEALPDVYDHKINKRLAAFQAR